MEKNVIIEELKAVASLDWNPEQKAYYSQRAADATPVSCVRMRDVFTPEQLRFLSVQSGYKTHQKQCYKNASDLVRAVEQMARIYDPSVPVAQYVEGFVYSCGLLSIEHAFVKIGDRYIDPTFERALRLDVRKEIYVSCIELSFEQMSGLQAETGYYGELYQFSYLKRNRPDLAAKIASRIR